MKTAAIRLVFVSHSFPPIDRPMASVGGMQRVSVELDAALRRRSDVSYTAELLKSSWRWVHVRTPLFMVGVLFRLRRMIVRQEVDVILFSSMVTASLAVLLRGAMRTHDVQAAAIVHGKDVTEPVRIYQWFIPRIFAALNRVLPVSGPTGEACTERGLPSRKLAIVHNGVDVTRFPAPEWPAGTRSNHPFRADLPTNAFVLCSVGRQVRRKGFAWFIEHVMPALPENVFYLLGGDGPEESAIELAIQAKGLASRVRRLGRLSDSDLLALYGCADLFVMPNIPVPGDMEGFGIVMLEAGLNGLPTVASRLEGIREVIAPSENGYFVESMDTQGYVGRIVELEHNRDALAALSGRTRAYVIATFGWDRVATNYIDALSGLVSPSMGSDRSSSH